MTGVDPPTSRSPLPLFAWLSPAFPVGAFAYSHGIETAVDAGWITDAASLEAWLCDLLRHGSARQDSVLAAESWRLARTGEADGLAELNDLALALAPSRERRLETASMGRAFADTIRTAWPEAHAEALPRDRDLAYPVAFGATASAGGLPLGPSLDALALAFVSNLVSAAVRLGPIGQTDGQRVTASLLPEARRLGTWAATSTLDDLGACALRSDIAALQHEILYSRLFRS